MPSPSRIRVPPLPKGEARENESLHLMREVSPKVTEEIAFVGVDLPDDPKTKMTERNGGRSKVSPYTLFKPSHACGGFFNEGYYQLLRKKKAKNC